MLNRLRAKITDLGESATETDCEHFWSLISNQLRLSELMSISWEERDCNWWPTLWANYYLVDNFEYQGYFYRKTFILQVLLSNILSSTDRDKANWLVIRINHRCKRQHAGWRSTGGNSFESWYHHTIVNPLQRARRGSSILRRWDTVSSRHQTCRYSRSNQLETTVSNYIREFIH